MRWLFLALILALVGCGGARTARPTAVPEPTAEPTAQPTNTAQPTATEEPTATTMPTPAGPRTTDPAGVQPLDKDNCPEEYPIKGNIRDDGGMIYHEPNYRSYGATDPEICFALVEDAVNAGFSRPENN